MSFLVKIILIFLLSAGYAGRNIGVCAPALPLRLSDSIILHEVSFINFQFLSVWTHCLFYSVDYNSILSLFILMFSYPRLAGGTPLSLVLEPFSPHSLSASLLSGRTGYSHSYCAFPAPAQESVILLRSLFLFLVSVENLKTRI